jgi:hypothetical protein
VQGSAPGTVVDGIPDVIRVKRDITPAPPTFQARLHKTNDVVEERSVELNLLAHVEDGGSLLLALVLIKSVAVISSHGVFVR